MLTCVVPVARLHQSLAKEKSRLRNPSSLQERRALRSAPIRGGVWVEGPGNRMGVTQVV